MGGSIVYGFGAVWVGSSLFVVFPSDVAVHYVVDVCFLGSVLLGRVGVVVVVFRFGGRVGVVICS